MTWKLAKPSAVRGWYLALAPIARPPIVLGCERCKMLCVIRASDCTCCAHYGKRTGGGTKYFPTISGGPGLFNYDSNALGHTPVMRFTALLELIAEVG